MSVDIDSEERILLGGQISAKLALYQHLAQLGENAFVWSILENWQKIKALPTKLEKAKFILYLQGQCDFAQEQCSEITKLSMILGDTRQRVSAKGLKDELLAKRVQNPVKP